MGIVFWPLVLKKLIFLKNRYRITSIVDLLVVRYGKSQIVAIVATLIATLGTVPYIALQLKAVASTFVLLTYENHQAELLTFAYETGICFFVSSLIIIFTIKSGIHKLDSTEQHPGMIAALVTEGLVKLITFLIAGAAITFILMNNKILFFEKLLSIFKTNYNFLAETSNSNTDIWITYLILSASAILFLPRQFHLAVVENTDVKHISKAMWVLPLYFVLINIFVIPIALAGIKYGLVENYPDSLVLTLSQMTGAKSISILTFIGGFSAAIGMIMVSTVTISNIITNNIYLPLTSHFQKYNILNRNILNARRVIAALLIYTSSLFALVVGNKFALFSMGMISFSAAFQFVPSILGGLYWDKGNKYGAITGLSLGGLVWFFTIYYPALIKSDWISSSILEEGFFGLSYLKPHIIFGFEGVKHLPQATLWSFLFNSGGYFIGSLLGKSSEQEKIIASDFTSSWTEHWSIVSEDKNNQNIKLRPKVTKILRILNKYLNTLSSDLILVKLYSKCGIDEKVDKISITQLSLLCEEFEINLSGIVGSITAHIEMTKSDLLLDNGKKQLSIHYAELLSQFWLSPKAFRKKIEYHVIRDQKIQKQVKSLEIAIKNRTQELELKNIELLSTQEKIIQQEKLASLGRLTASIAHEIKNPLNIINNASSACLNFFDKELPRHIRDINSDGRKLNTEHFLEDMSDVKGCFNAILESGEHADRVVKSMLNHSTKKVPMLSKLHLPSILKNILTIAKYSFLNKTTRKITIIENVQDVNESYFNREEFERLILNVLENSIDTLVNKIAINDNFKPTIKIVFRPYQHVKWFLIIQDNGMGISEEIQNKILEPFFTTKPTNEGIGLGLSMVNDIVKTNNGEILIKSKLGRFTRFVFIFPFNQY
ncbi:MAG: GHKL domain-containing protein [Bdellovibrionaceae bacterium]|nr:GHKL domain-containing protein [Pseudobdellovibrionaceae bacterium]